MQALAKTPPRPVYSEARQQSARLWLALCFHALPLVAARGGMGSTHRPAMTESAPTATDPVAVVQMAARTERIMCASPEALQGGVALMMKPAEARLACPSIRLLPRDPSRERQLLHKLADILGEFSSDVSIYDDLVLVMEIGRSLRLFGGVDRLIQRLENRLDDGPDFDHAMAPTPLAAVLCARSGLRVRIDDQSGIRSVLGNIPVEHFEDDRKKLNLLFGAGIRVMRDLFRLPRHGLTRRFGSAFVVRLDHLLGAQPDILPPHIFRTRFHTLLHLDEESTDLEVVLSVARMMLADLERQLSRNNSAVRRLRWTINADRSEGKHVVTMGFTSPLWRADAIEELSRLRLGSITLITPVRTLSLETEFFVPLSNCLQTEIPGISPAGGSDTGFLDRLRSRLGDQAIRGIRALQEHRPEYAWSTCEPGRASADPVAGATRPLWLLTRPRPLATHDGIPYLDGPLKLQADEERLRCGWWDGRDIVRSYRQALTRRGQRLWVFRDVPARRWYLHGMY